MINILIVIAVVLLAALSVFIQIRQNKGGESSCGCGTSCSGANLTDFFVQTASPVDDSDSCRPSDCSTCGGCGSSLLKTFTASEGMFPADSLLLLSIDGMHCEKCQESAATGLNAIEGVLAIVDLSTNTARLRLSKAISEHELKTAIADRGFTLVKIQQV